MNPMVDYKKLPAQPTIKPVDTGRVPDAGKETGLVPIADPQKPLVDAQKSRETARLPVDLGKKIAEQRVLYQPQAQKVFFHSRQQLSPEMRGMLGRAFQSLLGEPLLRQMRGSDLSRFLEGRFTDLARGTAQGLRKIPLDLLQRLYSNRHHFEDKSKVFTVIRFEVAKLKEERAQNKERVMRASGNASGESKAAEGEKAASSRLEKEAFLKRASHNLKNLNPDESESVFESLLKKVLAGQESAPNTSEGKKAQFKGKSEEEWKAFFKNVLANGSQETSSTQSSDNIQDAFYRGLYKNLSSQKGMTLVTDIKVMAGDKELSEKFARIAIENPQLIEKLAKLNPGDDLPKEFLKLLGESIEYTKIVNKADIPNAESGQQLLAQLRHHMNPNTTSRLEQQLIEERKRVQEQNKRDLSGGYWDSADDPIQGQPSSYLGREFEERERQKAGRPKLWLFMAYSLSLFVLCLVFYLFFRSMG